MLSARRSGAPRLIEWTGERCVPWAPDVQVIYEHLHRYLWAAELVAGRTVLDLASGEGFGAGILARTAASVTGLDVDPLAVDHSALNYASDRISFTLGNAEDLSAFADDSFGAVVAFELIEHVAEQARVLAEVARVLAPDGLFIVSTPDRRAYASPDRAANPFHVRELDFGEFSALLTGRFEHVSVWGQRTVSGSALSQLQGAQPGAPAGSKTFFVALDGERWSLAASLSPMYLVAVASQAALPSLPQESVLADGDLRLVRAAERSASVTEPVLPVPAEDEADRQQTGHDGEDPGDARDVASSTLAAELADRELEIAERRRRFGELAAQLEDERARSAGLKAELADLAAIAAEMRTSITWKLFRRLQARLFAALGGRGSLRVRVIQGTLRRGARLTTGETFATAASAAPAPPLVIPEFPAPQVSIVIPCYARADLTEACLEAIVDSTSLVGYEVILVDDDADAATKALLERVQGATVLVNATNEGYLRSVNRGAAAARARWIVLCNNDIEPRDGWLTELLACAQSADDVGIVTPRYLFPDLTINEAGGIIWRDATGMNYGRGQPAHLFHYGFRREVDYGSAAALLIRASLWHAIGGYDERYAPMYYEDADLCFAARERGFRVLYEPRAEVVHVEGATAGTDPAAGHKRYQEVNRRAFAQKWASRLAEQPRAGTPDLRGAANRARGPRVLIIDYRVPSWDRDAGSLRLWHMIGALSDLGCRITLLPDDRKLLAPYGPELERMGVEVWHGDVNIASELESIGFELTLAILCRPHTAAAWLDTVREKAPAAQVVYDTIDLHWLRELRREGGTGAGDVRPGSKAAALRELELAVARSADRILAVSEEERSQLQADIPGADVRVIPTVHAISSQPPSADTREGVIFVGGFDHPPNVDAAVRLVADIMPLVWRRLGPVPVSIVGGSPPPEVKRLASGLVDVVGWLPEIEPALDRAVAMVAPLTWGAGVKGKVTQALAAGLPVVTTSLGAEGLAATDGDELLIADDDEGLAERVILALTDAGRWNELSRAGLELAQASFSAAVMAREIQGLLTVVAASPQGSARSSTAG